MSVARCSVPPMRRRSVNASTTSVRISRRWWLRRFVQGSGEVDADARQRRRRHSIEEREQVAVDHSDLMQPLVLDRVEHGHDTRRVDLHADHVDVGFGRRHRDRRLTVAEPDVEHDVAVPAEHVGPVEWRSRRSSMPQSSIHVSNSAWRFGDNDRRRTLNEAAGPPNPSSFGFSSIARSTTPSKLSAGVRSLAGRLAP